MKARIERWGSSLAVRLPDAAAASTGLVEGQSVELACEGDTLIIRTSEPRLTLEDMFQGRSPSEWRALYAGTGDWGPDVGREVIDG